MEYHITIINEAGGADTLEDEDIYNAMVSGPLLLEACQEWAAFDEVIKECNQCGTPEGCSSHARQLETIWKMRDAAIKAALGG